MTPSHIVGILLEEEDWVAQVLGEASVHLPHRGNVWVAAFTGVHGQQWKSTGTTDRTLALAMAKEFEAAARAERMKLGSSGKKRIRLSPGNTGGGLTQREVALVMGLSERAIREIEKRALRKLAQNPTVQELWRSNVAEELTEPGHRLSRPEMEALLGLIRTRAELQALLKVLAIVQA